MKNKFFLIAGIALLSAAVVLITACGAILTPPESRTVEADPLAGLVQIRGMAAGACCSSEDAVKVIDDNVGTMWGAFNGDSSSDAYHAHGGGHYLNIDLGLDYQNITRVEYIPAWTWSAPGGYSGSNNGICGEFEIYVTEKPLAAGEYAPAENLAAYGQWYALENGTNSVVTNASQKFIATFSSVKGRYVQFKFKSAYYNHWSGYPNVAKIAQAAEIKVFANSEPYTVARDVLQKTIARAEALRAAYPARYGYTNAILNNWAGKGKKYLETGDKATKEMVDYVLVNLNNYIALASKRIGDTTYDRFIPKIVWADNRGNHLQAHGGGVMYDPAGKKWWFYGEDRTTDNGGGQPGVHGYSSDDLYNWKDEGVVLPVFNNTEYDTYGWKAVDWDGDTAVNYTVNGISKHRPGFVWSVNQWRKALGDWNCDGVIDSNDQPYQIPSDLKSELLGRLPWWDGQGNQPADVSSVSEHEGAFFTDEKTLDDAGKFLTADEAWAKIKDYIPSGNPPLYIGDSDKSRPYAGALGLDSGRISTFNALYSDEPVWRRKQLYRYYNYQTIIERPKVVYNPNTGERYRYRGEEYPYVMFVHIEGGTFDSSYGTARVAIAAAKNPQGPFKFLWAYRVHFVENTHSSDNKLSKGMTRDQGVLIDSDGNAYQFGSTEENRFMAINKLDRSYTTFAGIPQFAAGGNQTEMLQEGYQNRMGVNFNWIFGSQREAPAPFIHYNTDGMTQDNGPVNANKYYFGVTSYSSGWFPNPQGKYRTAFPGGSVLGSAIHAKPNTGVLPANTANTAADGADYSSQTDWLSGNGWVENLSDSGTTGGANSLLFGEAGDGSHVDRGFDGQTTHIFQLRYPDHPWGIVSFADAGYMPPASSANAQDYYDQLDALYAANTYTQPVYDERPELAEPRAGKLVYGKYVYLSDSWDQYKNYDARYIWLPMRALADVSGNTRGLKIRWLDQWRWQDFVYDLGPFKDSLTADPAGVDIWNDAANDIAPLQAYYEMLGNIDALKANAGKQNPGLNF